jgi:hypothetical protein
LLGEFGGEAAEQAMQAEPIGGQGFEQVSVDEDLQCPRCRTGWAAGQRGDRRQAEHRPAGQPEQPEYPPRIGIPGRQGFVTGGETGADGEVTRGQLGQPCPFVGQFGAEMGDGPAGTRLEPGRRDMDGERQPGAAGEHARGGFRLGGGTAWSHDRAEHRE